MLDIGFESRFMAPKCPIDRLNIALIIDNQTESVLLKGKQYGNKFILNATLP